MAVPSPVAGAYIMILLVLLFLHGLRMVAEEGLSFENGMVVCVAFWLAIGFQDQAFFHDLLPEWWRGLLDNGMTAGGIIALVLTALLRVRRGRVPHLDLPLRVSSIQQAQAFVTEIARESGWDRDALLRLELALEEAVVFLIERQGAREAAKRLRLQAKVEGGQVQLELVSGGARDNLERALAQVDAKSPPGEKDAGLRILGRLAERVRHQQFHGTDVLLVDVGSRPL
jgi:NCS2 family nucleobase:cation symporter-2/xanthine permease XanP